MNNPNDMRSFIEIIDEASLKDLAKGAKEHVKAAAGNKKSQGAIEAKRLAKYLKKQFQKWLGQTGAEQNEEALLKFLVSKIGFTPANARKIFAKANVQDPIQSESIMEALNASQLDGVLLAAAQFAYEHDLVPDDDDDHDSKDKKFTGRNKNPYTGSSSRRGRYGSNSVDDILKGLAPGDEKYNEQKFITQLHQAAVDEETLDFVRKSIEDVKAYRGLAGIKDSKDVIGLLSRIGFAYLKSQSE